MTHRIANFPIASFAQRRGAEGTFRTLFARDEIAYIDANKAQRDYPRADRQEMTGMASASLDLPEAAALAAFEARDRSMDGRFVIAVKTTRIYCKPSCPARRPRRENFERLRDNETARQAGYRPCLR